MSVAPGPPRVTVAVNGRFEPAPSPVTVDEPFRTAVSPLISAAVIGPVTYITFVSKLPLPGLPASALGASARHSKSESPDVSVGRVSVGFTVGVVGRGRRG